ncbi:MAG TPA: hypothetical protein VFJ61_06675 [Solirubrobacterales bacterium]|nr:hypothetical protein [Solirubrobacterales bacterium]
MDVDRLNTGEKIAGGSAIALFIFMFFDWFTVDVSGGFISVGGNAWEVFSWIDLFLMLTIIVTVALVVIRLSESAFEPQVSLCTIVAVLGGISVLLILFRIIDPPGGGDVSGVSIDINPAVGVFLGLIAAAGITYGGYRAMQEEGTTFGDVGDRLSGGGGPGAPGGGPGATGGPGAGQPPASTPQSPPPPPPPQSGV